MDNLQQSNQENIEQVPFSIGSVHHNLNNITPTASEVAHLWTTYEAETMAICFLKKWVNDSKDPEIHSLLQETLDFSTQKVQDMENLFHTIDYPTPSGFGEKDVDIHTPALFSETFTCLYVRMMQGMIMHQFTTALQSSYRSDIRKFYSDCLQTCITIENKATEILLAKGILQKHPGIVPPRNIENVSNKGYFGSFIRIFGEERPLNAAEITHLYNLMEIAQLVRTLSLGYAQVVQSDKIRNYLLKKKDIIDKNLKEFTHIFTRDDVPVPSLSQIMVTDTKEPGMSDKLILNHSTASTTFIISSFGLALPAMARKDLIVTIGKILTDVLGLAKHGADLLIDFGWLEQIPQTADPQELTH